MLESMTLTKMQLRWKERVAQEYADLVYNGLWFSAHHQDLAAYVQSSQRHVTGDVRMRLHRGTAVAVGRRSDRALYSHALATYSAGDQFDQTAALGFIKLWGLPVEVQSRQQLQLDPGASDPMQLGKGGELGAGASRLGERREAAGQVLRLVPRGVLLDEGQLHGCRAPRRRVRSIRRRLGRSCPGRDPWGPESPS